MAIVRGAKKLFDWLRTQKMGTIVSNADIMRIADWSERSLATYVVKHKIAPFLLQLEDEKMKVLMNGADISEAFFDETFTQTAPRIVPLTVGDKLQGEAGIYQLVEPLGQGAVGHVWSARQEAETKLVAVKVMLPRPDLLQASKLPNVRERFRREGKNGKATQHAHIVSYLDHGNVEKNPFLVMELADRSVADHVRSTGALPEEEAAEVVAACLEGLVHLHGRGCTHRDVKPPNILEFHDVIKLGDLGIVLWSDFDPSFTHGATITRQSVQLGSWFYMAPEQQQSPHDAGPPSDLYALGVSWIEMLNATLPSPQAIGARAFPTPTLRTGARELIDRMVAYDPSLRPSASDALGQLRAIYPA